MDIVERLEEHLRFNGKDQLSRDAKIEIEWLRKVNVMQARWLHEAQQEHKKFKDYVRKLLSEDFGNAALKEGE
jgi:hypothetical protein